MAARDELDAAWAAWQKADLYARWKKANPGEARALELYRNGGARPSLVTATGQALVAETAAWLLLAPLAPPPAPSGIHVGPGELVTALVDATDGDTMIVSGLQQVGNLNISTRVTILNEPGQRATIKGRLVLKAPGIVIDGGDPSSGLLLDGQYAGQKPGEPSWTVTATDVTIRGCDMTNRNTTIGVNAIPGGDRLLVEKCWIHDIGPFADTASAFDQPVLHKDGRYSGNRAHGVYLSAVGCVVRDTEIWACSDRAVQFRGSTGCRAERVWAYDNGMGFMFGDLAAADNHAVDCRAEDNTVPSRALVESYLPGTGNTYQGVARNADGRQAVNAPGVLVTVA